MDLLDRDKLADFANNTKDKTIDANDIMRFPTVDPVKHGRWITMSDADGFCKGRGWPEQLVPDDGFCDKGKRSEE